MAPPAAFSIDGLVIGVTGAGKGIGRGIASQAVAAGARVFACSRTAADLASLQAEVAEFPGQCATTVLDLSEPDAATAFADFGVQTYGRIDAVVNNVGGNLTKAALDYTAAELDGLYALNLRSTYLCCLAAARVMIDQQIAGSIVNISSRGSLVASPWVTPYSAMKAGVNHLTRSLAVEWAEHGIRVNGVAPGATLTPALQGHVDSTGVSLESLGARVPLGRRANTVDDVVFPVLFLLSPAASMITGQLVAVDGGSSL